MSPRRGDGGRFSTQMKLGLLTPVDRSCDVCSRMTVTTNRLAWEHSRAPLARQPELYQRWRRVMGDTMNHMLSHFWRV